MEITFLSTDHDIGNIGSRVSPGTVFPHGILGLLSSLTEKKRSVGFGKCGAAGGEKGKLPARGRKGLTRVSAQCGGPAPRQALGRMWEDVGGGRQGIARPT